VIVAGYETVRPLGPGVVLASGPGGLAVLKRVPPGWAPLVDHPNVLGVLAVDGDVAVLPYAAGGSLAGLLARRGRLHGDEVAALAARLAGALAAVHAAGRLHLDVTPGNVLLTAEGAPLLADPGAPGRGTPGFVAPEVLAGGRPGPPADVFGLGATCRAALGGDLSRGPGALAAAVHPNPAARPTAAGLAAALAAVGPGRLPIPPDDALPVAGPVTVELPIRPPVPAPAGPRAHRPRAAAAAVAALLAAAGGAAWVTGRATAPAGAAAGCRAAPPPPPVAAGGTLLHGPIGPGGCPGAVAWDPARAVASVGGTRFRIGSPGDALLVGDWDGDGRATPALYRPSTGEVLTFGAWPAGGDVASDPPAAAPVGGTARVVRDGPLDRVEVTGAGERA
jgi:Protein kinase domain